MKSKILQLDENREKLFVAQVDEETAGFVHIEKYDVVYCETGTNILGLAVKAEYQRMGIGKMLMTTAENYAKEIGASWVRLNSGGNRKDAHKFYRNIGYNNEKEQIRFIKYI